jgi:hypothetical protein
MSISFALPSSQTGGEETRSPSSLIFLAAFSSRSIARQRRWPAVGLRLGVRRRGPFLVPRTRKTPSARTKTSSSRKHAL